MKARKIKYICNAMRWFDRVNGNTYHSVKVTRVRDSKTIYAPMQYGYGDHYRQTALEIMIANKWIKCAPGDLWTYERNNNYPVMWNVFDGLKRDCIANGRKV